MTDTAIATQIRHVPVAINNPRSLKRILKEQEQDGFALLRLVTVHEDISAVAVFERKGLGYEEYWNRKPV